MTTLSGIDWNRCPAWIGISVRLRSESLSGIIGIRIDQQHALRQGVEHVRQLGDRALAELLLDLAERRADLAETLTVLAAWRSRLTPAMTQAVRAGGFPDRSLRSVA